MIPDWSNSHYVKSSFLFHCLCRTINGIHHCLLGSERHLVLHRLLDFLLLESISISTKSISVDISIDFSLFFQLQKMKSIACLVMCLLILQETYYRVKIFSVMGHKVITDINVTQPGIRNIFCILFYYGFPWMTCSIPAITVHWPGHSWRTWLRGIFSNLNSILKIWIKSFFLRRKIYFNFIKEKQITCGCFTFLCVFFIIIIFTSIK